MLCFLFYTITTTLVASCVSHSVEENVFLPADEGPARFGILTNDQRNDSFVENIDVQSKLRWQYATKSGYRIGIYDNILTSAQLKMLRGLVTYKLGSWSYRISEARVKSGQNHVSTNNIPWYNELDTFRFSGTILGKQLETVIMKFAGKKPVQYHLYKAVGHILRRGDFPTVYADAYPEDDEMTMMIYLNPKWRKNDYGDLYLYDDDKEIVTGVVPRYGRIVVWQSSIPYLPRPPSVAFKPGQLFLHISFTKNQTKVYDIHSKWLKNKELQKNIHNKGFFTQAAEQVSQAGEIPIQSHLISEAKSKNGKKIVVFDGLFSRDDLDNLRSAILNHGVYYYDDTYDEESDNVQWIAGFEVDHFVKSNLWITTQQVAKFVSGGHADWFPYDISCNLIRNADTTQIHHDCEVHEDEWTFLLYLNPDWTINDYGETVFYERNTDNTEIITEVLPKYGRVVIFQGIIPHSARPPSTNFSGARLSFAVKLSINEWTGRRKAFQEQLRHLSAVKATLGAFKSKFENGNDEDYHHDRSSGKAQPNDEPGEEEHVGDPDMMGTAQPNDEPGEEEHVGDPDMMEFHDTELDRMESRLEMLLIKKERDIKDLRALVRELHRSHFQARENIGEFFYQFL